MATSERLADRGERRGQRLKRQVADEFREARVGLALSQAAVAAAAGISRAGYGRIERGESRDVGLVLLARIASVLGLDLVLKVFPAGPRLRDAGHLKLLQRLRERLGPQWRWRYEVPLRLPGDQRAWDAVGTCRALVAAFDAESRLHDVQALVRREQLKVRDGGVSRLVLVVADTDQNRASVRAASDVLRGMFPVSPRRAFAALCKGQDPGGDALVLL